jgi:hypothetical protein
MLAALLSPAAGQDAIRVGADHTPPFYSFTADGQATGLAVEVLNEAARRAGYQLQWVPQTQLADESIGAHAVDMWPLVARTAERSARFAFAEPWLEDL